MRKPLLLLVDDERSVLEALEAELRPEFEQIARIEAFDDPRAVLEALPRWQEEGRSIAVAIVDQKMPRVTGVALLSRLRALARTVGDAFHPATCLRALLLTGYADLDAAIAAKNEATVDRYIEKPWQERMLLAAVCKAFRNWLQDSGAARHYFFREVMGEHELRELLRLRFEVYSATDDVTRRLLPAATAGLDADHYDHVSRFFGLFSRSGATERLIGTLRVVGQGDGPARAALERVVAADPDLEARVRSPRRYPLPLMAYLKDRDAVQHLYDRLLAAGEGTVEPGRLTLAPRWRAGSVSSERHLARHIIESAVAFFFFFVRVQNAILTCVPPHDAFYKPYGFLPAEGTRTRFHPELNAEVACLHGRIDRVPPAARQRCSALAGRIARTGGGGTCYCASYPACLSQASPSPYESGDFRGTDVFCPLRAQEVLAGMGGEGGATE